MPPIQRILFPTEFNTTARLAEEQACTQARAHGADATAESLLPLTMADALVSAQAELLKRPDHQPRVVSHGFQGMLPIHQVRGSGLSVGLRI